MMANSYMLHTIGVIRELDAAPRQGYEGAPDAWIEVFPPFEQALHRIVAGDELIILTWLHQSARDVLQVIPAARSKTCLQVFLQRSLRHARILSACIA